MLTFRFLNLCAANSRKQGTFYETARRNNLPDWLINIRHDFAHDQKVPSKFMLYYCLNYCLDWLKREYWDVQYRIMRDFVALNKIEKKQRFEQYIILYEDIVLEVFKEEAKTLKELPENLQEKLYSCLKSNHLNDKSTIFSILRILSKAAVPSVIQNEKLADHLSSELFARKTILKLPKEDFCNIRGT